jgi:hypothetical protein
MKPRHERKKYLEENPGLQPLTSKDLKRLRGLCEEIEILMELGGWNRDEFDRIMIEYLDIRQGKTLECGNLITDYAEPEWVDGFTSRQLRKLSAEVDLLLELGELDKENYIRILTQAKLLTTDGDRLQFISGWAESGWPGSFDSLLKR